MDLQTETEDQLIQTIGDIGRFQLGLFFVTGLTVVIHAWQMLVNKFLTYPVPHYCKRPAFLSNAPLDVWLNASAPFAEDGITFDRCRILDRDYSSIDALQRPEDVGSLGTIECTEWEYDESLFMNTATKRFDLVCSRSSYRKVAQTIFFIGTFFGVVICGFLADVYGRMRTYLFWISLWTGAGILEAFVTNFWVWTALRFLVGGASIAYNTVQTVYCIEISGQKWRSVTNNYFRALPFSIGYAALALMVYLLPNMIHVELFIACSGIPFVIIIFFLPESPRWLLVNGHLKKGFNVVEKACRINKLSFQSTERAALRDWSDDKAGIPDGETKPHESGNLLLLLKYPASLRNLLAISFCWFSLSMAYFGLVYNTPTFNYDVRVVFVIPPLVVGWMPFVMPYFENTFGRKVMMTLSLTLCGVPLLATLFVAKGYFWVIIVLAYIGQLGCAMAFDVAYSYTRELFPTSLRSSTMGFGSGAARVGSVASSTIALLEEVSPLLPVIIYGLFSLAAAAVSVFIWPETKNLNLPDSLGEAEKVARTRNSWLHCCSQRASRRVGTEQQLS